MRHCAVGAVLALWGGREDRAPGDPRPVSAAHKAGRGLSGLSLRRCGGPVSQRGADLPPITSQLCSREAVVRAYDLDESGGSNF